MRTTRTLLAAGALTSLALGSAAATETYLFDTGHTEVRFSWDHVGISRQSAGFDTLDGTVTIVRDDVPQSAVDVTVDVASVNTGVPVFDEHLVSDDWFDAAAHPAITFESTGVRQVGPTEAMIDGDLTIKDITKPVTLTAKLNFDGPHPLGEFVDAYAGQHYVGFEARTTVLRSEWDLGGYAPLVSDAVEIVISTEMRRADPTN
ncbi:MAG: YceI family protein [Pseudomonadota bacterium]